MRTAHLEQVPPQMGKGQQRSRCRKQLQSHAAQGHGGGRRPSNAHRAGPRARLAGSQDDLHAFISNKHTGSKATHDETVDSCQALTSGPSWFSSGHQDDRPRLKQCVHRRAIARSSTPGVTGDLSDEPPTRNLQTDPWTTSQKENPTELHGSCEKCRTHETKQKNPQGGGPTVRNLRQSDTLASMVHPVFWLLNYFQVTAPTRKLVFSIQHCLGSALTLLASWVRASTD